MSYSGPVAGDLLAERYRLIDPVGAGGMSVVWRARDEVLDRLVAVKWLGEELAGDRLFHDLVRREAWATARIKHPAVAAVYDYGEVIDLEGRSRAFVVMEMLDGESLADRLRLGPLPWREAVGICAEVADAIATAHEQGVVHRDISPDNVMLTSSGLRLFDFGIAARIGEPDDDSTGSTFGTPAYVAPERLHGQPAQTATDVYSLGVLLFETLTGRPPFPEDTWNPDAGLDRREPPRLRGVPGLPAGVARLCRRCLAYDPAQRPPAREVADRLAAYARPWWRGRTAFAGAAALVALAGMVALAGWGWGPLRSGPAVALDPPGETPSMTSGAPAPATSSAPTSPTPTTPTPAIATPSPTATLSPPRTGTVALPTPPLTPPSVESALDALRDIIDSEDGDGIDAGAAQELRNQVDALARALAGDPYADVSMLVKVLDEKVRQLSSPNNKRSDGTPLIHSGARKALEDAIDALKQALAART